MAGKRQEKGKPLRRIIRFDRRKARLAAELATAANDRDRISIAADYVRTCLAVQPDTAEADAIVAQLVAAGDRIYEKQERRGAA